MDDCAQILWMVGGWLCTDTMEDKWMAVHGHHGCELVPWMVGKWLCTDTMEHMWLLEECLRVRSLLFSMWA